MVTTVLLAAFALVDLVVGRYLVRYSGGVERRRPEAVLLVGMLLVLAAGFLIVVVVRLHARLGVVRERALRGAPVGSSDDGRSSEVDAVSAHSSNRLQAKPIGKVISGDTALCVVV